ncbi:MAG: hypothetical protein IKG97_07690 [Lachnospiraceae bacterium]|nr:hypothetical protein [Lachnospiraceae bacterium]
MSRFIPMPAYVDSMPVDISSAFGDEKPAGKHGFVRADGDDLRFEDGTLARFWGVNFNGGACFPPHDYADKVAERLAQSGCNIVRFHQLDAEFDTPNIFAYTKGPLVETTRRLDPRSMDALDYLVSALKKQGVYCYLDMITYRKFKEGDGVKDADLLMDAAKPWSLIDPTLIALQKEYAEQLWTHVNPYTGLAYKDDPVFVLTEIINETDVFLDHNMTKKRGWHWPEYYLNEYREMFRGWLQANGKEFDWEHCEFFDPSPEVIEFKTYLTAKYYKEVRDHIRSLGVRIPIAGSNWNRCYGYVKAHEEMDFTDSHLYIYDWRWGNTERRCKNESLMASSNKNADPRFGALAAMKVAGKPFFISEWDMPWPNCFRAEGPIYFAVIGALQGWSGFAIHTYAYTPRLENMKILGREMSAPVGGVPYREGIFSVWNDPAKFGLFCISALITRRADITPAKAYYAIQAGDHALCEHDAQNALLEHHRVGTYFGDEKPDWASALVPAKEGAPCEDHFDPDHPDRIISDNGQVWRSLKHHYGCVDTERTKVVYGMLNQDSTTSLYRASSIGIELKDFSVSTPMDFGVIALSSLTNDPVTKSRNLLIATIGRAHNEGQSFDGEKMLDVGRPPILAEVIPATIRLRTEVGKKLRVWGINAEGFYAGQCQTSYEDGWLTIHVGDEENPACYYLVQTT